MKKSIKVVAFTAIIASLLSFVGCSKSKGSKSKGYGVSFSYADVEVGKSYTDITATIKLMTYRTDMLQDGYTGVPFSKYLEEFKKLYLISLLKLKVLLTMQVFLYFVCRMVIGEIS